MSFQRRVTLASAAAVAIAVAIASARDLRARAQRAAPPHQPLARDAGAGARDRRAGDARQGRLPAAARPASAAPYPYSVLLRRFPDRPGDVTQRLQTRQRGRHDLSRLPGATAGAVGAGRCAAVRALARSGGRPESFDATANGTQFRVQAAAVGPGYAVVVSHSLTDINSTLDELRLILVILTLGGIALAALARLVRRTNRAGAGATPDATVQHVAATRDLGERIDERRRDELGSLARSFNSMLTVLDETVHKLDESARMQRRLVADASHELRTPVTSVRTNIEILERAD